VRGISHAVTPHTDVRPQARVSLRGMAGTHVLSQNSRGGHRRCALYREMRAGGRCRVIDAARAVSFPTIARSSTSSARLHRDGQRGRDAVGMSGARSKSKPHHHRVADRGCRTSSSAFIRRHERRDLVVQVLARPRPSSTTTSWTWASRWSTWEGHDRRRALHDGSVGAHRGPSRGRDARDQRYRHRAAPPPSPKPRC